MAELTDIALNKPATQSSASMWSEGRTPEEEASRANSGFVADDYAFHTQFEANPWWQVDLGGVFEIHDVRILNRRTSPERLSRFSVLVSLDGSAWETVYVKDDDSLPNSNSDDLLVVRLEPPVLAARYIRIQLIGTMPLHFRTCQVFGKPLDAAPFAASIADESSPAEAAYREPQTEETKPEPPYVARPTRPLTTMPVSPLKQVLGWLGIKG